MNTASKTLCQKLYALRPDWNDTYFKWNFNSSVPEQGWYLDNENLAYPQEDTLPACDLSYLLRKLEFAEVGLTYAQRLDKVFCWGCATYAAPGGKGEHVAVAPTPEDAACQVLCKLILETNL